MSDSGNEGDKNWYHSDSESEEGSYQGRRHDYDQDDRVQASGQAKDGGDKKQEKKSDLAELFANEPSDYRGDRRGGRFGDRERGRYGDRGRDRDGDRGRRGDRRGGRFREDRGDRDRYKRDNPSYPSSPRLTRGEDPERRRGRRQLGRQVLPEHLRSC